MTRKGSPVDSNPTGTQKREQKNKTTPEKWQASILAKKRKVFSRLGGYQTPPLTL